MNHAFILVLGLLHAGFLIAISIRLRHLGCTGKTIIRLIALSLGMWPMVLLIGAVTDYVVLWAWGGLPPVIVMTLMAYVGLEMKMALESDRERDARLSAIAEEERRHREDMDRDARELAAYVAVKSYVGEDQNLCVISDLGKLKSAGIRCKIEGSLVRTLFVKEADIDAVRRMIALDVGEDGQDPSSQG